MAATGSSEALKTPRLRLEPVHSGVAEEINRLVARNIESFRRWLWWADKVPTLEQTRLSMKILHESAIRGDSLNVVIRIDATGEAVGMCGLKRALLGPGPVTLGPSTENEDAEGPEGGLRGWELGYWLARDHEGKGLVTEAAAGLVEVAFGPLQGPFVLIHSNEENEKSWRVAERLGFRLSATLESFCPSRPDWPQPTKLRRYIKTLSD